MCVCIYIYIYMFVYTVKFHKSGYLLSRHPGSSALRKIVPRPDMYDQWLNIAPSSTDSMTLFCVIWTLLSPSSYYKCFKHPKTIKQGTAGKRKLVTSALPQILEIIRRHESGESWSVVLASYTIQSSNVYYTKKQKDRFH